MNTREYCCYTRPYSEIEGLQLAHTLLYSASAQPEGIVLELRFQQGGGCLLYTSAPAFCVLGAEILNLPKIPLQNPCICWRTPAFGGTFCPDVLY